MLKKVAQVFGVDKAIFFTTVARILQGAGGIVSVIFISAYLTGIEQGFYYTFASILAMQVFFELGLGGILIQFTAHENAHLTEIDGTLTGNKKHLSRLSSLLHFCTKWYSRLTIGLLILLIIVGFSFFSFFYKSSGSVNWQVPWVLLSLGTTTTFLVTPIAAILEGLGKVKEVAKIRLISQCVAQPLLWLSLLSGAKLYSSAITSLSSALIIFVLIYKNYYPLLKSIYKTEITDEISYKTEIFPYQWKIALSWISGYFIFQIFNPVVFATQGAVMAGKMGMTITILAALQGLTMSWMSTKTPILSNLISLKRYEELDSLFNKTLKIQLSLAGLGLLAIFVAVYLLNYFEIMIGGKLMADRILSYYPMIMMMIPMLVNQYIGSVAIYLRCHKKEPFLYNSITCAVLNVLSAITLGNIFGVNGITTGYCVITLLLLPWGNYLYTSNKKSWHNNPS